MTKKPNVNALNALVLWGVLSPKLLSLLTGVSVSFASRALKNLVNLRFAEDLGRTCLPPEDPLYGRYYRIKNSSRIQTYTKAEVTFRPRINRRAGGDKIVKFISGEMLSRHYLFSITAAFWVANTVGKYGTDTPVYCFPESYLRLKMGWHRGAGPARQAANPRLTMVPDALVIFKRVEVRIEAEMTPKTAAAYRSIFTHLRPDDDTVFFVYPDEPMMGKITKLLPKNYRLAEIVLGDEASLEKAVKRLILSLFDQ